MIIAIDPGMSGGIVLGNELTGKIFKSIPMPSTETDIANIFQNAQRNLTAGIIENVHSFPKQGVASSFKFGQGYGFLRGCLISRKIPFLEVAPQRWMGHFGMKRKDNETKTQYKNRLRGLAQQYFPVEDVTLKTADALLLFKYYLYEHYYHPRLKS